MIIEKEKRCFEKNRQTDPTGGGPTRAQRQRHMEGGCPRTFCLGEEALKMKEEGLWGWFVPFG